MCNVTKTLFLVILFRAGVYMNLIIKIAICFVAVLGFFYLSFVYITGGLIAPAMEPVIEHSARRGFDLANSNVSEIMDTATDISNQIMFNPRIAQILAQNPMDIDHATQVTDSQRLAHTINAYTRGEFDVRFYINSDFVYVSDTGTFRPREIIYSMEWHGHLTTWAHTHTVFWFIYNDTIAGIRGILDPESYHVIVGFMQISIPKYALLAALSNAISSESSNAFLLDRAGREVVSYNENNHDINIAHLRTVLSNGGFFGNYVPIGADYFVAASAMPRAGLYLISVTALRDMMTPVAALRMSIFWYIAVVSGAAFLLAFFVLRQQYKTNVNAQSAEFLALQSQINPHFLYNTLDMINWAAIKRNAPEISESVLSLSKYYKLSLNNGVPFVPLKDELEHARLYVDIMFKRMGHKTDISFDIAENLLETNIMRLTLQPIVENAVIHGILQKETKTGHVRITACSRINDIVITVSDDGVGIAQDKLDTLLTGPSGGYGIRNTHQRIKLHYGKRYGLRYESTLGAGTTVEILYRRRPS